MELTNGELLLAVFDETGETLFPELMAAPSSEPRAAIAHRGSYRPMQSAHGNS